MQIIIHIFVCIGSKIKIIISVFTTYLISINKEKQILFTAQCYADHGYATVCRLSICQSITYRDHIGWNSTKIISRHIA